MAFDVSSKLFFYGNPTYGRVSHMTRPGPTKTCPWHSGVIRMLARPPEWCCSLSTICTAAESFTVTWSLDNFLQDAKGHPVVLDDDVFAFFVLPSCWMRAFTVDIRYLLTNSHNLNENHGTSICWYCLPLLWPLSRNGAMMSLTSDLDLCVSLRRIVQTMCYPSCLFHQGS